MSFYTSLTGLGGAQADLSATSNNIANVGTTGFKRSRAEFGDIFATSPLQNSSSAIGSGTILKSIKQQFTQGNIASSLNALDMAISGQGFFALKPTLTSTQTVYTRNGSLSVNNDRYVIDSAGQYLQVFPVNEDGSVTSTGLDSAVSLQLPTTSGLPQATTKIDLGLNLPADAEIIPLRPEFSADNPYVFSRNDPDTFNRSTSITIFDSLGNPTIATVYYAKTSNATEESPTNKWRTYVFVGDREVEPALITAKDDQARTVYSDRFGRTTTDPQSIDPTFNPNAASSLYKLDDQTTEVNSAPAKVVGENVTSVFDFGETDSNRLRVIADKLSFNATREGGNTTSDNFWGNDFFSVSVDGSEPKSISIREGSYNGEELAAEMTRAVNASFSDERKIRIDSTGSKFNILLYPTEQRENAVTIAVDLLSDSFVTTDILGLGSVGTFLELDREQFLAHVQDRVNVAVNAKVASLTTGDFGGRRRVETAALAANTIPKYNNYYNIAYANTKPATNVAETHYLLNTYVGNEPDLKVYDGKAAFKAKAGGNNVVYDATAGTLTFELATGAGAAINTSGVTSFAVLTNSNNAAIDGKTFTNFTIPQNANGTYQDKLVVDASSLTGFDNFTTAAIDGEIFYGISKDINAYFEGSLSDHSPYTGAQGGLPTGKIIVQETGTVHEADDVSTFTFTQGATTPGVGSPATDPLKLLNAASPTGSYVYVNETAPPIKVGYDILERGLTFQVDSSKLNKDTTGLPSYMFEITNDGTLETNSLGVPRTNPSTVLVGNNNYLGGAFVPAGEFLLDQVNHRFGMNVSYAKDTRTFQFASGTTGETITSGAAVDAPGGQVASTIQVGRQTINSTTGVASGTSFAGASDLLGIGTGKSATTVAGVGLRSLAASTIGARAIVDMTTNFQVTATNDQNVITFTVDGIVGRVTVPVGTFTGETFAAEIQRQVNLIEDPTVGTTISGVTVGFDAVENRLTFTSGTQGDGSQMNVVGSANWGLLETTQTRGSVPQVTVLAQEIDAQGNQLYVDADGNRQTQKPAVLQSNFFPLYLDEGELTFDSQGKLLSPKEGVIYSPFDPQNGSDLIRLSVDYGKFSTQFAQPFSVLSLTQDGFTSGRLDGLDIDAAGTVRANYTNGTTEALGKIILANFNNQNGLKQVGNATYVATSVSGDAQLGEAGGDGFGSILSGSLERSNVDITEELVNLITAQRNFQANAKAIETTTTLTSTIINIR